jgi:hypothetical protein
MTEDVMKAQVGGNHYSKMGMQPFVFTMANRYDPLAHTINKYVARHESKGGKADLEKAVHCTKMRLALLGADRPNCLNVIPIRDYIDANGTDTREAAILTNLHHWALGTDRPLAQSVTDAQMCQAIVNQIGWLIEARYENKEPTE